MEKFSLPEFELCAQYIYYKDILEENYNEIIPKLNVILKKCNQYINYNIVEEIFSRYLYYKTSTEVYQKASKRFHSTDYIIDVIIFKQSEDADINLLAKVKCYKYGRLSKSRKNFLKWQIDKLLLNDKIDMMEEYKNYKLSQGISEYIIPSIITQVIK